MTKNEYIASIMLEAAKLLKNDNESLNEGVFDRLNPKTFYTTSSFDISNDSRIYAYLTEKEAILSELKTWGKINNNTFEEKSKYSKNIKNVYMYKITAYKYEKHPKSSKYNEGYDNAYELNKKGITNITKIKTYKSLEDLAKQVNIKIVDKKIDLNERKKNLNIAYKIMVSYKSKLKEDGYSLAINRSYEDLGNYEIEDFLSGDDDSANIAYIYIKNYLDNTLNLVDKMVKEINSKIDNKYEVYDDWHKRDGYICMHEK